MKKDLVIKQCVGIDVSKGSLECCFMATNAALERKVVATRSFPNAKAGIAELATWAKGKRSPALPLIFVVEATGTYHEPLADALHALPWAAIWMAQAAQVRNYAKSMGTRSKTDKVDASILAGLGLERELREWKPPTAAAQALKALARHREDLQGELQAKKNRLGALQSGRKPPRLVVGQLERGIKLLETQISKVEAEMKLVVDGDPELSGAKKILESIVGIGPITSMTILAETGCFENFTNVKQVRGFAGLDPMLKESGKWKGRSRISKRGSAQLRKTLFNAARSAINHNPQMKKFYERLIGANKVPMAAMIAVMGKLIKLCFSLFKSKEMYDRNFEKKFGGIALS